MKKMVKKVNFMIWAYLAVAVFGVAFDVYVIYRSYQMNDLYVGYFIVGLVLYYWGLVGASKLEIRHDRLKNHLLIHDLLNKTTEP